ncbi:MAG: hypothetical protein M1423_10065, partial [Acidobacteria bacterium]|nr:hypothetical protein [Acidobacteriota bacterium]
MGAIKESLPRDRKYGRLEYQLSAVSPVVSAIVVARERMLRRWWELYVSRFAGERTLSEPEFDHETSGILDMLGNVLLPGDIEGFQAQVRDRWRNLARRGLPFAEAMVIVHLFEESALSAVPGLHNDLQTSRLLSQGIYQCVSLIADAYLQAGVAEPAERPSLKSPMVNGMFHGLVGSSAPMLTLYRQIEAVGRSGSTALIEGVVMAFMDIDELRR